jgi:hypothetical protein
MPEICFGSNRAGNPLPLPIIPEVGQARPMNGATEVTASCLGNVLLLATVGKLTCVYFVLQQICLLSINTYHIL